ncbi:MAG: hypothetical protein HFE49_09645 [Clostridia bacterium]|nr:hypothetical protein [Clostridia bacterium]
MEYNISILVDIRGMVLNQYTNSIHSIEIIESGFYDNWNHGLVTLQPMMCMLLTDKENCLG